MGGQIAVKNGRHIDMRQLSRLIWFRPSEMTVRVQAGMTWRALLDLLDPHQLSVKIMQSYSNFTIGGSISVNCHGRYVGAGSVANSVRALSIVLADGTQIEASRTLNADIFCAAIGGYGACGIIVEAELDLGRNVRMARSVKESSLTEYFNQFANSVVQDRTAIMHNADLLPPRFDRVVSVTWRETDAPITQRDGLIPRGQRYSIDQDAIWLLTEVPGVANVRSAITHPLLKAASAVRWRNQEASLDIASLEPRTRRISTYVLQEFFVPIENAQAFAVAMAKLIRLRNVEVLNVSIRHSPADHISLLPWAKSEVFSFVLYFKQRTHNKAMEVVGTWTRELIEIALSLNGRYYLPYQLHATRRQFERAYPEATALRALKARVDPNGKLSNELWERYL